ncbi:DNA-binding MarR family transcriptional regulator [Actinoplanes octamycinicus]|uniref:DNA-binding MarR family transcriptional regulator n=1 Tax=Actinoplanes octamycinicus TaxID=135948 RepID=A0A7W7H0U1_9ACTN|nr:MarR family winged helix-turn-helix transcriptional regulator [Actinoplanes octamycinicus]MBB4741682.1 DNA-binding MarR family transcriptional regulator [Actinoplanes octamycinicus]GIE57235.1 MarR family transcriptional regulator [Actinoplanes octamycinicus]
MPSQQDVGLAVKRLQWVHHRESNRRLSAQAGLSLVQWDVLRHVHRNPDASLHALAELTFQTDQSMGELARRMIERGLLRRVEGPGRAVRHALTDEGTAAYEAGSGIVDTVLTETVGRLTPEEQTILFTLLEKARAGSSRLS